MLVLAVSGRIVVAVAIVGALVLLAILFRAENRYQADQDAARARAEQRPPES